jgi:hypothetical protein
VSRISAIIRLHVLPPLAPSMLARAENTPPNVERPTPSIPTRDLDQDAVDEAAWFWLVNFYTQAGKRNPFSWPVGEHACD